MGILEPLLLAALDGDPVRLARPDLAGVRRARAAIARALERGSAAILNDPVTRREFLTACRDLTVQDDREHLIVGYGYRSRQTTLIESVHHNLGDERSVSIPQEIADEVTRHHARLSGAEVLLFHNHPRTGNEAQLLYLLKALLNDLPIASMEDRFLVQKHSYNPLGLLRHFLGQGRIVFYLGESGFVREISLPNILTLVKRLTQLVHA